MPPIVCMGATGQCSFGATISIMIMPKNRVMTNNMPAGTMMDNIPMANLVPAGVCTSMANPAVAAATALALGVLTPQPCVPVVVAPWAPSCTRVMFNNMPAINSTSMAMCNWGGVITVTYPGQVRVQGM
jgi:hypothetical protein